MPRRRNNPSVRASEDPYAKYRDIRNFDSVADQIRTWLDDDPPASGAPRGYAGMTDAEVVADMLIDTTQVQRDVVNGDELLENTDKDELDQLRNGLLTTGDAVGDALAQREDYNSWVNLICIDSRTYERTGAIVKIMRMVWGNSSQTFANLTDYYNNLTVDRGTWLIGRVITEQDVAEARAL